jgi:hypothetical protein
VLKKTFKYKNLIDESDVEEDFYFHLSPLDLAELEKRHEGGYQKYVESVSESDSFGTMFDVMRELIELSVGRRSGDGKRFLKSPEITEDFVQSPANEQLFMEFLEGGAGKVVEFFNGVMPEGLVEKAGKMIDLELPAEDNRPAWVREDREPTPAEIRSMSPTELQEAFLRRSKQQVVPPS